MKGYDNFTVTDNASRDCSSGGVWAPTTDYNDCMCNSTEDCSTEVHGALEISIIIYLVGRHCAPFMFSRNDKFSPQAMSSLSLLCVGPSASFFH